MKIKFKRKHILILGLVILLSVGIQLPAFIYNEYEFMVRANYQLAEMAFDDAETMIDARTGKGDILVSDQKKADLYLPINQAIEVIIEAVNEQKQYVNKQDQLIKFLPKKFRQYHQLKQNYLNDYSQSFAVYQEVKLAEHWLYSTMERLGQTGTLLADIDFSQDYSDQLTEMVVMADLITSDIQSAGDKGWLTESMETYLKFKTQKFIDIHNIIVNPDLNGNQTTIAIRNWQVSLEEEPNFNQALNDWHQNLIDPIFNQGKKQYATAVEKLTLADGFYTKHNLGRDWITVILSKFSDYYPKNI